jgi:hypothetical protein
MSAVCGIVPCSIAEVFQRPKEPQPVRKEAVTSPAKLVGQLRCAALNVVGVPGGRT